MNAETYAEHWGAESMRFESRGLYADLARITPVQRVLEIGSGNGIATAHLAFDRKVLGLDNNPFLLRMAKANNANNPNAEFMETDVFNLSQDQVKKVTDFSPQGIVAWMIGSDPDTVDSRTSENTLMQERPKLYREAVEDLIVIEPICAASVEWIHMTHRIGVDSQATNDKIREETVKDYEGHMLLNSGFRVARVDILEWKREPEDFMYVSAANQNFKAANIRNCILSILATRG
jgi:SAM-dependent methyltransferase